MLVATMLKIGTGKDAHLYGCCWNFHREENKESFFDMSSQDRISIHFLRPEYSLVIEVPNRFQDMFAQDLEEVKGATSWTTQAFDLAREAVDKIYPQPGDLWRALIG